MEKLGNLCEKKVGENVKKSSRISPPISPPSVIFVESCRKGPEKRRRRRKVGEISRPGINTGLKFSLNIFPISGCDRDRYLYVHLIVQTNEVHSETLMRRSLEIGTHFPRDSRYPNPVKRQIRPVAISRTK